ncbi:MAG: hypothetical protein R3B90_13860 [Planctomycetaceae bacterium]
MACAALAGLGLAQNVPLAVALSLQLALSTMAIWGARDASTIRARQSSTAAMPASREARAAAESQNDDST